MSSPEHVNITCIPHQSSLYLQSPPDSKKQKLNRDPKARRSSRYLCLVLRFLYFFSLRFHHHCVHYRHRKQRGEVSLTVGSSETLRDVKVQVGKSFFNNISSGDGYLDQFCWICAASLSEPLPIVFYSVANYRPNLGREGRKKEKLRTRGASRFNFSKKLRKEHFWNFKWGTVPGPARYSMTTPPPPPSTTFQNAMPSQDVNSR